MTSWSGEEQSKDGVYSCWVESYHPWEREAWDKVENDSDDHVSQSCWRQSFKKMAHAFETSLTYI